MTPRVDDPDELRRILREAQALLLDFDGPVCSVFSGFPAPVVAGQLRELLADGGYTDLPTIVAESGDPFDVLHYSATLGADEAQHVEAAFRAHETEAVSTAEPTPGTVELIHEWKRTGQPVAIVSNNSASAVEAYLNLHGLQHAVDVISSRSAPDPGLLKPNPHLVLQAAVMLGVQPDKCVLIGDSVTDIEAAHAAGARGIGYANKSGKGAKLAAAGADAITTNTSDLARSVATG
ncbi:HAD superfamily hydrolase (TIGR01509 family) [Crossiella equi]|uniref:HAD superfamily hydrolase (TIGR01509 family) n=1 Tax=Crossiella equi TaxID=130796 RepID=A0ABS5ABT6_9PSEU|nr:HAD family phosphatase [Crossiella equi]MBP2474048.1 HAD superfamily hydrolase (TIGR01509 family) [Crossiella equi]